MSDKPLSPQQLKFCKYMADGLSNGQAYLKAYNGVKDVNTASASATRLLKNVKVADRIKDLQQKSEAKDVLTRQEKRKFLAQVVRTNVEELTEEENKHLIQERTRTITPNGGKKEVLKMPSKMEAIKLDNLMAGDNEPEVVEITAEVREMTPIEFTRQSIYSMKRAKKIEEDQKALESEE